MSFHLVWGKSDEKRKNGEGKGKVKREDEREK